MSSPALEGFPRARLIVVPWDRIYYNQTRIGHAEDWTLDIPHAKRVWYHYTTCPRYRMKIWFDYIGSIVGDSDLEIIGEGIKEQGRGEGGRERRGGEGRGGEGVLHFEKNTKVTQKWPFLRARVMTSAIFRGQCFTHSAMHGHSTYVQLNQYIHSNIKRSYKNKKKGGDVITRARRLPSSPVDCSSLW